MAIAIFFGGKRVLVGRKEAVAGCWNGDGIVVRL